MRSLVPINLYSTVLPAPCPVTHLTGPPDDHLQS